VNFNQLSYKYENVHEIYDKLKHLKKNRSENISENALMNHLIIAFIPIADKRTRSSNSSSLDGGRVLSPSSNLF